MQEHIIGYLLGALNADEIAQMEHSLASDGEIRRQLIAIRFAFAPLESDRQQVDVPKNLALRTCRLIREIQKEHASTLR